MKTFDKLNEFERIGVKQALCDDGWEFCRYHPENKPGMTKNKIGFMLKDLIIEE